MSLATNTGRFNEAVTEYDKMGNIVSLQRQGKLDSGYGMMDNLTYSYTGNRLTRVSDAASPAITYANAFHFVDRANVANEYTYDVNGNLTKDLNKNITAITYNALNLPSVITFADGNTITYGYDAAGSKLSVAYKSGGSTVKTEYAGNKVYKNGTLSMILTQEGYLTLAGTTPTYYYYLKDHQGNNRVVINQAGTVEQVNHYYLFGGLFGEGLQASNQPYRYNGKELDRELGLDMYDYGARHYDATLGRWLTVDPMAEKYYSISQYAYVANNPVRYIDPNGMWYGDYYDRSGNWLGKDKYNDKKVYHAEAVTKDKDGLVISATNADEWHYSISDTKFQEYYPTLLSHEGGFVNHKNDPGGSTNKGITLKTFKKYSMDLLNVQPTLDNLQRLTDNQAAAIYEIGYWNVSGAGNISDKQVGWLHFDTYVNGGATRVLEHTIKAYGGSAKDINILNSLIKVNSGESIFNTYKQERMNRYDRIIQSNPKLRSFRKGWENRVNSFQYKTY